MLTTHDQINQALKKSQRVLLTCRQDAHIDSLASCLSLYLFLKKLGIEADVVLPMKHESQDRCSFLPGAKEVRHGLKGHSDHLIIRVSRPGTKVGKFHYDVIDHTLNIYVTPSQGKLEPSDVVAEVGRPSYDLIISCDTPDLISLGSLYTENAEFFLHTPIINIDHSPANENYGHINQVDITHVSVTEALFHLFEEIADEHIDADIATTLLTGMIAKTHSFRSPNVTPRSLIVASELVQRGGRRDEIIQYLYRQHELSTLRLWGRVLARLHHDDKHRLLWSVLRRGDFEKSGAGEETLVSLIEELIATTPQAKFVVLIYEKPDGSVGAWLKTDPHTSAIELTAPWGGAGSKSLVKFSVADKSADEVLEVVKKIISSLPTTWE